MRGAIFILTLYLLALAVLPCADEVVQVTKDSQTEAISHDNESDHPEHQDFCSPFCICSCCGSLVCVFSYATGFANPDWLDTSFPLPSNLNFSSIYQEGVWHPPATC